MLITQDGEQSGTAVAPKRYLPVMHDAPKMKQVVMSANLCFIPPSARRCKRRLAPRAAPRDLGFQLRRCYQNRRRFSQLQHLP